MPILLAGALAALAACDRKKEAEPQPAAPQAEAPKEPATVVLTDDKGKAAPAMPFVGPDDAPATLATFRGKPLLVNMWATWCAPCIAEMGTLDALAAREAGRVQVVAISQDMEGRRAVGPFFAKRQFKALQPYLDKENVLMLALKADSLPLTILYDAEGKELWRVRGAMDWTGAKAKTLIDDAVAGRPVAAGAA
ncbi:MAG: TlpA disulfide reductase family protein [Sphingomonas fennica]